MPRRSFLKGAGLAIAAPVLLRGQSAFANDALSQIKTIKQGKLVVATNGIMPMVDTAGGAFKGVDGEIISRIAKKLNLEIEPALMEWGATVEAVRTGRADIVLGNLSWTDKRARVLALTDAEYFYTSSLAQRKGSIIKTGQMTITDLKGHSIGTIIGGAPQADIKKMDFVSDAKFYDMADACVRDILAGRLDFGALDGMQAAYMFQTNPSWDIELVDLVPDPEYPMISGKLPAVIGVNPEQLALYDAINSGLNWLWKTGQVKDILAAYGLTGQGFITPLTDNMRVGIDRDESGKIIGVAEHEPIDFSAVFS
jgi:polar amino acid transport system substrate-binding protein